MLEIGNCPECAGSVGGGGVGPWSHHDWNEAIGYAHLDPEYWPRRKGPFRKNGDATGSATKRATMSDLPKKKAPRLNSMSLSPTRGRLKGRRDHETRLHMPLPPLSANAACQLHRCL